MKIEKLPGYMVIKFTYELDRPQLWAFIEKMKEIIPPSAREYEPKRKIWTIAEVFVGKFNALYDETFRDKNQEELF